MSERILLVDDDDDIRTIAQMALEAVGGMSVRTASSAEQALAALDEELPDLVVLDVMMPGVDGPTTLARIQERSDCAHLPVVFMTAKTRRDEVAGYLELGAVGVIAKPFDPLELANELRVFLAGSGG